MKWIGIKNSQSWTMVSSVHFDGINELKRQKKKKVIKKKRKLKASWVWKTCKISQRLSTYPSSCDTSFKVIESLITSSSVTRSRLSLFLSWPRKSAKFFKVLLIGKQGRLSSIYRYHDHTSRNGYYKSLPNVFIRKLVM